MGRFLIILLGLVALAILAFFCINKHGPEIEDDLVTRTQQVLDGDNKDFAKVVTDGRELILTGIAPDEAARERAGKLAREVYGVRTVDNQLTLAHAEPEPAVTETPVSRPEPEPVPHFEVKSPQPLDTQPAALFPAAPSPYHTEITYKDGKILLTGLVADDSSRLLLVSKAKEQFGDNNVIDQMTIAYGAPQGWHKTIEAALINFGVLESGKATLVDNTLTATGFASRPGIADQVESEITDGISSNFKATYDINANEPEPVPVYEVKEPQPLNGPPAKRMSDAVPASVSRPAFPAMESCQQKFNSLLSKNRIHFDTNKAIIKPESYALLDKLVDITKECPNSSIEVGGHTDARGTKAHNQWLSESRANAVVDYLKKHGVTSNKLHGVGYGELKPIAENSTREGMAKNRRIEFKVGEK